MEREENEGQGQGVRTQRSLRRLVLRDLCSELRQGPARARGTGQGEQRLHRKRSVGIGGHISTYASAATLYEVAFNHFFHGKGEHYDGDQVYFQGHASPGIYTRAWLEGRITEEVRYAAERHVTIVPEIEMPYHAGAAIVAVASACPICMRSMTSAGMGWFE